MATFSEKIKKAIRKPSILKIRFCDFLFGKLELFQKKYPWRNIGQTLGQKVYKDYDEYVSHQRAKLSTMDLGEYDERYFTTLKERLAPLAAKNIIREGNVALCLAARIGTEVRVFLDYNCFAVGIDLNPGQNNQYVLTGDFHDIRFPQRSVDIIFTNSLDHSLYFDRLIDEMKRVLKPGGYLILEIVRGIEEGGKVGYYEAFAWPKIDNCLRQFTQAGFKVLERHDFTYPWGGQQVVLTHSYNVRN